MTFDFFFEILKYSLFQNICQFSKKIVRTCTVHTNNELLCFVRKFNSENATKTTIKKIELASLAR